MMSLVKKPMASSNGLRTGERNKQKRVPVEICSYIQLRSPKQFFPNRSRKRVR